MQFNTLFSIIVLVTSVSAIPAPASAPTAVATSVNLPKVDAETAFHHLSIKKAAGCSLIGCVAALAPTVVSCASAIAEEGVNIIEDFSCLAEAAKDVVDIPDECSACL